MRGGLLGCTGCGDVQGFKLKKPVIMLAPMAGVAERAFRKICKEFGAEYLVSEMISAAGVCHNAAKTLGLCHITDIERPIALQLFGSDPGILARAAEKLLLYNPTAIDLNFGCPAPKITGSGGGSELLRTPELIGRIVNAVASAVPVPVTAKIRTGIDRDNINAVEVAKICEANGASLITVHGRTKKDGYSPPVDMNTIKSVKESVKIPVIGNGDISDGKTAAHMLSYTGCDGIMIGRASLGAPYVFAEIKQYLQNGTTPPLPTTCERLNIMRRHIEMLCRYSGEYSGMREARKHIIWYLKGFSNSAKLKEQASSASTLGDLYNLISCAYESRF